jgi:phage shock protein A
MDDLEGQIEAYDIGRKSLSDEIGDLEHAEDLQSELDELKAKMGDAAPAGGERESTNT